MEIISLTGSGNACIQLGLGVGGASASFYQRLGSGTGRLVTAAVAASTRAAGPLVASHIAHRVVWLQPAKGLLQPSAAAVTPAVAGPAGPGLGALPVGVARLPIAMRQSAIGGLLSLSAVALGALGWARACSAEDERSGARAGEQGNGSPEASALLGQSVGEDEAEAVVSRVASVAEGRKRHRETDGDRWVETASCRAVGMKQHDASPSPFSHPSFPPPFPSRPLSPLPLFSLKHLHFQFCCPFPLRLRFCFLLASPLSLSASSSPHLRLPLHLPFPLRLRFPFLPLPLPFPLPLPSPPPSPPTPPFRPSPPPLPLLSPPIPPRPSAPLPPQCAARSTRAWRLPVVPHACVATVSVGAERGMVVEPKTKHSFPVMLRQEGQGGGLLAGVGIRDTVIARIKSIKIYAFGLYVSPSSLGGDEHLKAKYGAMPLEELRVSQEFYDDLLSRDIGMTVRLVLHYRGLNMKMVRNALNTSLSNRLTKLLGHADDPGFHTLNEYLSLPHQVKRGTTIDFTWQPGGTLLTEMLLFAMNLFYSLLSSPTLLSPFLSLLPLQWTAGAWVPLSALLSAMNPLYSPQPSLTLPPHPSPISFPSS
ncbi:unnamed protein product [Closterium sp. NIES-65]|nr:unnamed protein product [Closterium sp. NIES-65]